MATRNNKRLSLSILLLIIIHLAGIIGLHSSYRNLFLTATPFNLILTAFLLVYNHKDLNRSFFIFLFLSFIIGYFVEVIGVSTGMIFGHYYYEETLGFKILNVPVIIGINWFILTFCAGVICDKIKSNIYIKSCIAGVMLVIMDFVIERIAPEYNFWYWDHGIIPVQNYIAWFVVSFLLLLLFYKLNFSKVNKLAAAVFIIQIIFFAVSGLI